jgi:hypothetical protein
MAFSCGDGRILAVSLGGTRLKGSAEVTSFRPGLPIGNNPYAVQPPRRKDSVMAKGQQRSNKEAKKPKKDKAPPKPVTPLGPAITTVVPDRHKKK